MVERTDNGLPVMPTDKSVNNYDTGHQTNSSNHIKATRRRESMKSEPTNAAELEVLGKKGGSLTETTLDDVSMVRHSNVHKM